MNVDWKEEEKVVLNALGESMRIDYGKIDFNKMKNRDFSYLYETISDGLASYNFILQQGPKKLKSIYWTNMNIEILLEAGLLKTSTEYAIKNNLKFSKEYLDSFWKEELEDKEHYRKISKKAKIEKQNLVYRLLFGKLL